MKTPNTSRYAHLLCLVMPLACLAGTALADGGTDILTSSQHRKKNADITLTTLTWDSTVMIPLESLRAIAIGMRLQFMDFDGSITSDAKDDATIISRRERFNKDINFDMLSLMFTFGFTY